MFILSKIHQCVYVCICMRACVCLCLCVRVCKYHYFQDCVNVYNTFSALILTLTGNIFKCTHHTQLPKKNTFHDFLSNSASYFTCSPQISHCLCQIFTCKISIFRHQTNMELYRRMLYHYVWHRENQGWIILMDFVILTSLCKWRALI